jgi:hypothetical protein
LARPAISKILENLEQTDQPQARSLEKVLEKWLAIQEQISGLLDTANPNAILDCELNLALLTPRKESRLLIERFRRQFGTAIEREVAPARSILAAISHETRRLTAMIEGTELRQGRSSLLELCQKMASELSRLGSISDRIEVAK